MIEHVAALFSEIAAEMGAEYLHQPMRMLAETLQFAVLLGIVWVVALGFGSRKGFLANMLSERKDAVAARVEHASHAESALAAARSEATTLSRKGRAEARALVSEAKKECVALEADSRADADAECARIEERAHTALETEHEEMLLDLREQLVELVSSATRSILNEQLTASEQRSLIEQAILGSLDVKPLSGTARRRVASGPVAKGA